MNWRLRFICCDREDGTVVLDSWEKADELRESYTSGGGARPYGRPDLSGHERAVIVEETDEPVGGWRPNQPEAAR